MRDDLRRYTGCRAVKITQRNIRTVTVFDGDELSGDRITKGESITMLLQTNCPALPPVHIHTPGFSFGINGVYALGVVAASAAVIVFINKLVPGIPQLRNLGT